MKPLNAQYKSLSKKNKLLVFLVCFALSLATELIFNKLLLDISLLYLVPYRALDFVFGICFGWIGACASALAEMSFYFIANVLSYNYFNLFEMLLDGAAAFLVSILAFYIWHKLNSKETHIYFVDNHRRLIRYAVTVLITSAVVSLARVIPLYIYYGEATGYLDYAFSLFVVDVDNEIIFGLPFIMALSRLLHKWINKQAKKLTLTEKTILIFFAIELVMFIFILVRVYFSDGDELTGYISGLLFYAYQSSAVVENGLIFVMIILASAMSGQAGVLKGIEKINLLIVGIMIVVSIVVIAKYNVFVVSKVTSLNMCLFVFDEVFTGLLMLTLTIDKHKVNKQSTYFYYLLAAHMATLLVYTFEALYRSIDAAYEILVLLVLSANIFELLYLVLCILFISTTLGINLKDKKPFAIAISTCVALFIISVFVCTWLPALEILTYITWWAGSVTIYIFVLKYGRSAYEKFVLIALVAAGSITELIALVNDDLTLSTFGDFLGILLCFTEIYVSGSNHLTDTEKDLNFAFNVQQSMLPKDYKIQAFENIDLFASMRPAKEVGGDFYDFYKISNKHIAFVVADVSGKGTPGAMMMMRAITAIKNFAMAGLSVDQLMEMASKNINLHNTEKLFVTAWMGMLNVENGKLRFVNAGHNPPIIKHADGSTEEIRTTPDLIMGFFPDVQYHKQTMFLEPGDSLILYTDGFNEAYNAHDEQFGMERLHQAAQQEAATSKELCEKIINSVDSFVNGADQFDDMTIMSVKYLGPNNHIFSEGIQDIFGTKRPDGSAASAVNIDDEKFSKITFSEEDVSAKAIDIEVLKPEADFVDFAASQGESFEDLLKSSSEIVLDEDEHSSAEINLDELTKISHSIKLDETVASLPIEIEEVGSASPIEIEEVGGASPIEIEEVGSALPIEIEEVGGALPIEIEEVGSDLPIEIEEVGSASPIEIEEVGGAIPIEIEEVGGANPIVLDEISVDEYSAAPIEIQRDDMIRFSGHTSEALENLINSGREKQPVVIFKLSKEVREYAAKAVRKNVDYLTELMDSYLDELQCPTEVKMKMDISFDEIFSNVANYAYGDGEGDCKIQIQKIEDPLGIMLTIVDKGVPYNPLSKADPDPSRSIESRTLGGAGIFMVKKYMSDVRYEYTDGENRLTLIKLF